MTNEEKVSEIVQKIQAQSSLDYDARRAKYMYDAAMEMAEWKDSQPQIIEIFGKRVKIVSGDGSANDCMSCALYLECDRTSTFYLCKSADEKFNRHFVSVDEDGNEIK